MDSSSILQSSRLIVVAGLAGVGKTTLLQQLTSSSEVLILPDHAYWAGGRDNFPSIPRTLEEKKQYHLFFAKIDCQRYQWAVEQMSDKALTVICDSDFTSQLAFSYSEHLFYGKRLGTFEWLVEVYLELLTKGRVGIADSYIYLDAPLDRRDQRRMQDRGRKRYELFFNEKFSGYGRRFFYNLMHPRSPCRTLPAVWLNYQGPLNEGIATFNNALKLHDGNNLCRVDLNRLRRILLGMSKDSAGESGNLPDELL